MDKQSLLQGSAELKTAANKALDDFTAGRITEAEFNQTMEHCEKESERQGVHYKARQRANQFTVTEDGAPEPQHQTPDAVKDYRNEYAKVFRAAQQGTRGRAVASFHFGFKSWADHDNVTVKTGAPVGPYQGVNGLVGENAYGTTAGSPVGNGQYFLGGTVGPAVEPEFIPGIVEMRFFPTVIESLFPTLPVSSPVVSYVAETSWTNAAAATPEGATKPTSQFGFTRYNEQVGKVANLARITDEAVADAAYVWALIQRRLVMGVQRQTEVELLAGSNSNNNGVNGLLGRSALFTKPQTVSPIGGLNIPPSVGGPFGSAMNNDTVTTVTPGRVIPGTGAVAPTGQQIAIGILNMLTDIRTQTFFEPDATIINPIDYLTLRLSTDANGQYFGGSFWGRDYGYPNDQGQLTGGGVDTFSLWGKKLVTTPVIPAGLVLVGDFADAGAVLRLGGLQVDVTNLNGTDFEQNMWTARAETRVGLMVERPYLFELGLLETSGAWSS